MKKLIVCLFPFILIGCPTPIVVTPTAGITDAGDPGDSQDDSAKSEDEDGTSIDNCSLACLNLRKPEIHCAAGSSVDGGESCTKSCRHVRDSRLMPLDISCATKAKTPAEAHVCKGWGC